MILKIWVSNRYANCFIFLENCEKSPVKLQMFKIHILLNFSDKKLKIRSNILNLIRIKSIVYIISLSFKLHTSGELEKI